MYQLKSNPRQRKLLSLLAVWKFEIFFLIEQICLLLERKMLGVYSGIFKYRLPAKAKWKDQRDLKPIGEKKNAAAYF